MTKNNNLTISSVDKYQQILDKFTQLFQAQINQDKINQHIMYHNMQHQIQPQSFSPSLYLPQQQIQPLYLQPQFKVQQPQPLGNNITNQTIQNVVKSSIPIIKKKKKI